MRACFPKAAKTVFGKDIIIQHDYFHVMKIIHYHLNRAMAEYRRILKEQGIDTLDIWLARWVILKNMERWSFKECRIIENLLAKYQGTTIEDILILKQKIRDIFIASKSQQEAYLKRDALTKENWHFKNKHFANIIKYSILQIHDHIFRASGNTKERQFRKCNPYLEADGESKIWI